MPDTFLGLSVLVILFMPGVIFAIQADSRRPAHELSSLRELITIAGVGTICNIIVLLIFGLLRFFFPGIPPNIDQIERLGLPYVRLHLVTTTWSIFILFVASCLLAWVLGRFQPGIAGRFVSGKIYFTSAWWELFHAQPDCRNYVSCELKDGSYVAGFLMRYSTEPEETEDRELALVGPIMYRALGQTEASELENVHSLSIRAGQMKYMAVTYLEVNEPEEASPDRKFTWPWKRYRIQVMRVPKAE